MPSDPASWAEPAAEAIEWIEPMSIEPWLLLKMRLKCGCTGPSAEEGVCVLERAAAKEPPICAAVERWLSRWSLSRLVDLPEIRGRRGGCPALEIGGALDAADVRALEKNSTGLEPIL